MMNKFKARAGCDGDSFELGVEWFDHNGAVRETAVSVSIKTQDKPSQLQVSVDGRVLIVLPGASA